MPEAKDLIYLLVWLAVGLLAFLTASGRRWCGVGLALAFFVNMMVDHWFGAVASFLPWYTPAAGLWTVERGFELSTLGIVAYAIGCFGIAPFIFSRGGEAEMGISPPPSPRIIKGFLIVGLVGYLGMAAGLGQLGSVTAFLGTCFFFLLVSICIGLWQASVRGDSRRLYLLLLATPFMPVITLLTQGFLSFGIGYAVLILSFFVVLYKRRLRLALVLMVLMYLALSVFVTYMRDRHAIRSTIWGGKDYGTRVAQLAETFQTMEWFNPLEPKHLARIDDRLNLNWLVGAAAGHLDLTRNFAHGETIHQAALALIPRAIWPEKTVSASGVEMVSRYTGIIFDPDQTVAPGLVFEFYVNFGTWGVFGGLLLIGILVGVTDRRAGFSLRTGGIYDFAMWFLIGISLLAVESSLVAIVPGLIAPVLVTGLVRLILGPEDVVATPESIAPSLVESSKS